MKHLRIYFWQFILGPVDLWKEHGALDYAEYVIEDPHLDGTQSFIDVSNAKENEAVIFGWVSFESRHSRDIANEKVAADPRMTELIKPLSQDLCPIFDARRMAFGGFQKLVS